MAGTAHFFPSFQQAMASQATTRPSFVSGSVDTLKIGLAAGTFNWVAATEAYTTVSQFLANAGSGGGGALAEPSNGYARQTLTGVTLTTAGLVNTLNASSPITFPTATGTGYSGQYAFIYDYTAGGGSDTAGLLVCYWDFGGTLSTVAGGNVALTVNASGLVTWTAS